MTCFIIVRHPLKGIVRNSKIKTKEKTFFNKFFNKNTSFFIYLFYLFMYVFLCMFFILGWQFIVIKEGVVKCRPYQHIECIWPKLTFKTTFDIMRCDTRSIGPVYSILLTLQIVNLQTSYCYILWLCLRGRWTEDKSMWVCMARREILFLIDIVFYLIDIKGISDMASKNSFQRVDYVDCANFLY